MRKAGVSGNHSRATSNINGGAAIHKASVLDDSNGPAVYALNTPQLKIGENIVNNKKCGTEFTCLRIFREKSIMHY